MKNETLNHDGLTWARTGTKGESHCNGCDQTAPSTTTYVSGKLIADWCDDCIEFCVAYSVEVL